MATLARQGSRRTAVRSDETFTAWSGAHNSSLCCFWSASVVIMYTAGCRRRCPRSLQVIPWSRRAPVDGANHNFQVETGLAEFSEPWALPFEATLLQKKKYIFYTRRHFLLFWPKSTRLTSRPSRPVSIMRVFVQVSRTRQHGIILPCTPDGGTGVCPAAQRPPPAAAEPERSPPPFPRPCGPLGGHPEDFRLPRVTTGARSPQ